MDRYVSELVQRTPANKIILLSGPRQVGKTTFVRGLFPNHEYLNWDNLDHRKIILDRSWPRKAPCVIFDEIHKMPRWKGWLKGIYDVDKETQRMVVTGSARLDTYRKVGDSLAGRYFSFTLHPFDLQEAIAWYPSDTASTLLGRLLRVGGFPEPFLNGEETFYKMWRKSHLDIVIRQDLIDLRTVQEISKVELLIEHLRSAVGSPVSVNAISEDLQTSDNTIRSWLQLLEDLYVIFRVLPYGKNVKRAIQKSAKFYFYDLPLARSAGEGGIYENLVACALRKEVDLRNDSGEGEYDLRYLRNKDQAEVDFLILKNKRPLLMVEAKTTDALPSKHFKTLGQGLTGSKAVQVVKDCEGERDYPFGVEVRSAASWLADLKHAF